MIDVSNIQREINSLNRRQAARLSGSAALLQPATGSPGQALDRGTRVLDLVTGEQGVIVDATTEHIIIGSAGDGQG